MPTTAIYYWDATLDNGRRFRVEVIPPASGVLARTSPPAFGAEPGGGSNYVQIPALALSVQDGDALKSADAWEGGEVGFPDDRPWGMCETATYKLSINLGGLQSTASLRDLAGYIASPTAANAGTVNQGLSYARTFDTSTTFIITHDAGDSTLTVDQFATRFIGTRRTIVSTRGQIFPKRYAILELELAEIGRATLDAVRTTDLMARTLNTTHTAVGEDSSPSPALGSEVSAYTKLVDTTWGGGGRNYKVNWWPGLPSQLFSIKHLFCAMEALCEEAYCAFLRLTPDYGGATQHWSQTSRTNTGGRATCWDHWQF